MHPSLSRRHNGVYGRFLSLRIAATLASCLLPGAAGAQSGFRLLDHMQPQPVLSQELIGQWHLQCLQGDGPTGNCSATFTENQRVSGYLDPVFSFEMTIAQLSSGGPGGPRYQITLHSNPEPDWKVAEYRIGRGTFHFTKACHENPCVLSEKLSGRIVQRMREGASRSIFVVHNDNGRKMVSIPLYNVDAILERLSGTSSMTAR